MTFLVDNCALIRYTRYRTQGARLRTQDFWIPDEIVEIAQVAEIVKRL